MKLPNYPCCFPWVIPTIYEDCLTEKQQIAWLYKKVVELEKRVEELEKKEP